MGKKKKVRVELRKNRSKPPRDHQWTRGFQDHGYNEEATLGGERVRAKGDLSRKRTIMQDEAADGGEQGADMPAVDATTCLRAVSASTPDAFATVAATPSGPSHSAVSTGPGLTVFIRIPEGPTSFDSAFEKLVSAAFAAQ